jgi:hypothetical protein
MGFDSLHSSDRVEPLFPPGHPFRALVRPTFDTIRRSLAGQWVSTIWVDSIQDPSRAGFRLTYDHRYGPGSSNVMPFTATWLSTGQGSSGEGNVVALPDAIDRSAVQFMKDAGLLGDVEYVSGIADLKARVARSGRKVYSIDDLGEDFDDHSVISSRLGAWLNSKDDLGSVSRFSPPGRVVDMYEATAELYADASHGGGRVYLKACNTECAGEGVFIANSLEEYEAHLTALRANQVKFQLSRRLVIQPEIRGRNCSFQVFLDPANRDEIQIVAVTDQLVEADGKTYRGSINHPITREIVEHLGPVLTDMVERVWKRHPGAYGFLMCDYFRTDDGVVIYDPGIRPTGNTATALALHLARKLTNEELYVSSFPLRSGRNGLRFGEFARTAGAIVDPENLRREHRAVLPWGWNDVLGFGMLIGIAPDETEWEKLRDRICALY